MSPVRTYYLIHIFLTFIILSGVSIVHWYAGKMNELPVNAGSVIWASILTGLAFGISYRGLKGTPGQFSNAVLGGMMIKLMLSLGFITLILFLSVAEKKGFIASYFTAFFLLSGFEVYSLMNNLRPNS